MAYSVLIKNGTILDGSGNAPFSADIGIEGNKIKAIGNLEKEKADQMIDATNLYVTPGFIDLTNHADVYGTIFSIPSQESMLRQGVTTILVGNCGESLAPIANKDSLTQLERWSNEPFNVNWNSFDEYERILENRGVGINIGSLVGHWTLKRNAKNIEEMVFLLERSLEEGAWGLSSNFSFFEKDSMLERETTSLLRVLKKHDALYKIHLQDEGKNFLPALVHAVNLARVSGVRCVISHLKTVGRTSWKDFDHAIAIMRAAQKEGVDISFDIFPYVRTGSMLSSLLPEWAREEGDEKILQKLNDKNFFDTVVEGLKSLTLHPERITIASALKEKSSVGKTLEEISKRAGVSPEETLLTILKVNNFNVTIFGKTIESNNVITACQDARSMVASDGAGYDASIKKFGNLVHPRSFGAFARFFHHIAPKSQLSPERAIQKLTSLPARAMGLNNRGLLKNNYIADIAIFHPEEFRDSATYKNPFNFALGLKALLLSGKMAIVHEELVLSAAGIILRKSAHP